MVKVVQIGITAFLLGACVTQPPNAETSPDIFQSYPGYTGEYDGFTLVIDDHFNAFDETLWRTGDGAVGGESICRFQPNGVRVENGKLVLEVRQEYVAPGWSEDHEQEKGKYEYLCGELRTQDNRSVRYGRIEARMKAPARAKASGYISSLFTYRFDTDPTSETPETTEWEEIDVELEGGRPNKFQANLIYGEDTWEWWRTRNYGAWEDKIKVGPVDEWRVFAIEWLPDGIHWYVDGKHVRSLLQSDIDCDPECVLPQVLPAPIPDNPAAIIMNFWIPNDTIEEHFGGKKKRNVYPMTTEYDWLRYYELNSHPNPE